MIIVAERINASRKRIARALDERDVEWIAKEARKQAEAGATYIDVNAGTSVAKEIENLIWLAETVVEAVELPLCVDSANPAALDAALPINKVGRPMINSITGEKLRLEGILPLVTKYNAKVVALTMDDDGMPDDVESRVANAERLHKKLAEAGVPDGDIFFDVLIRPVSTDPDQAVYCLEAISQIRAKYPDVHFMCGMSNVSFGLPRRKLLNRTFLTLLMSAGQDGAILDPTEKEVAATLQATKALLGRDEYCMDYIGAERAGKLGD
jgi:5-methyltetrahydrofolate corrinoid/iron sulfur protein methyltransferase